MSSAYRKRKGPFAVSAKLRLELERCGSILARDSGSVLFRRGDPVHGVFLIRSGTVSLELDPSGDTYPRRTIGPGSVVGLPATLGGRPYSLTAVVVADAEVSYVPRQKFLAVLGDDPRLCLEAMKSVGREIARMRDTAKSR